MTALDDRPLVGVAEPEPGSLSACLGELRARDLNEREQYSIGWHEGFDAGYARAHREMAQWWAQLARSVRRDADRLRDTVPEPINRATCHCDGTTWRDCFTAEELAVLDGEE